MQSSTNEEEVDLHPKACPPNYTRVRLTISYDGTDFCGWQRQNEQPSVQGTIEKALSRVFNQPITLLGASRTDTGVHARGQVAHFDCPRDPTHMNLAYAIQGLTPPSIVVREVHIAPRDFHAIGNAVKKTYQYVVLNRDYPSALRYRYCHWVRQPLSLEYLNACCEFLVKKQDFSSFQCTGTVVKTTIREVFSAGWSRQSNADNHNTSGDNQADTLVFEITGDGFLKYMVRSLVGTMIDMNIKGLKPEHLRKILDAHDRRVAGPTAPPQGLFLQQLYYPPELDNKCRKL